MDINIFSQKMKDLRKARELSQDDVANKFGITVQAVSKWECGLSFPDISIVADIAKLYGVSTDYLLHDDVAIKSTGNERRESVHDDGYYVVELLGKKILKKTLIKNGELIQLDVPCKKELSVEVWSDAVITQ